MLKRCAQSISSNLFIVFNHSFAVGVIPSARKISRVTPTTKQGDIGFVNNYRPISLLYLVMKVQKRLVQDILMQHVLNAGAISDHQFGFMPASSTQEALLSVTGQ